MQDVRGAGRARTQAAGGAWGEATLAAWGRPGSKWL